MALSEEFYLTLVKSFNPQNNRCKNKAYAKMLQSEGLDQAQTIARLIDDRRDVEFMMLKRYPWQKDFCWTTIAYIVIVLLMLIVFFNDL